MSRRDTGSRMAVALVGVIALLAVACSTETPKTATPQGADGDGDPGVVHVHGLGVNPKDGALFAATHTGLFRIPADGTAERVAGRWQDTMGFTIAGPDQFLGSGHPDVRERQAKNLPSLLGLIESNDAGATWRPLSLLGQADFHALRLAHGRVYGYDSTGGALMVSGDRTTWEARAKVPMRDFAVSPSDPDLLVAAMARDVQRSRDGGRTWEPLNAPSLVVLAWQEPAALWGVTEAGALFLSDDGGATWQARGAVGGRPDAFLAQGGALYVSIYQGGIFASRDAGATWQLRYRAGG